MDKIVFLDLEETIIKSWHDRIPCNVDKVKDILKNLDVKEVRIFSFAIDNTDDVSSFMLDQEWIEKLFDFKILSVLTVDEIIKVCFKHTKNNFEKYEFKSVWGKTRAFHDYCSALFKNCECILLDDVVSNTRFQNHDTNLVISTIKI